MSGLSTDQAILLMLADRQREIEGLRAEVQRLTALVEQPPA